MRIKDFLTKHVVVTLKFSFFVVQNFIRINFQKTRKANFEKYDFYFKDPTAASQYVIDVSSYTDNLHAQEEIKAGNFFLSINKKTFKFFSLKNGSLNLNFSIYNL